MSKGKKSSLKSKANIRIRLNMTSIFELLDKVFKITRSNILMVLVEKLNHVLEQVSKGNARYIKNTIT